MDKQHLGSLPRPKVQNSVASENNSVIETTAERVVGQTAEAGEESPATAVNGTSTEPTRGELEATISQLRSTAEQTRQLEVAHQHEGALQQEINQLKVELSDHKKLVDKLQKELETVNQIKIELQEAKQTALQLAETNSKLIEEVNRVKEKEHNEPPKRTAVKRPEGVIMFSQDPAKAMNDNTIKSWLD